MSNAQEDKLLTIEEVAEILPSE